MAKIEIKDSSKLVFKNAFKGATKITVFVPTLRKQHPITREQIIGCIERGIHLDKINAWFTQKSIKAASKVKSSNNTEA